MVNVGYFISSVVTGVREGRATIILSVNVYCAVPPSGSGGRGYYKSSMEMHFCTVHVLREGVSPKSQPPLAQVIINCELIVWDKITISHKGAFEAVNTTLRDFHGNARIMGGVPVLLTGDF